MHTQHQIKVRKMGYKLSNCLYIAVSQFCFSYNGVY